MKKVNYENIIKNYRELQNKYNKKIYAVLKSNAYNHGLENVFLMLCQNGCTDFCVIDYHDCLLMRQMSEKVNILLMNSFPKNENIIKNLILNRITLTIGDFDDLLFLKHLTVIENIFIQIEIKSDMNRFGIEKKDLKDFLNIILENKKFCLTGVYAHFRHSFENQKELYINEATYFNSIFEKYKSLKNIDWHFSSSEGNKFLGNAIRVGIDLYSYYPTMEITGTVIKINKINKGESVSYFNDFIVENDSLVAICDMGYYNGIIKKYKNNYVWIKNSYYLIIGSVCMNVCFILIDEKIKVGDKVEFLGNNIKLKDLSEKFSMSMHEILLNYN